jgi:hypothetical protein
MLGNNLTGSNTDEQMSQIKRAKGRPTKSDEEKAKNRKEYACKYYQKLKSGRTHECNSSDESHSNNENSQPPKIINNETILEMLITSLIKEKYDSKLIAFVIIRLINVFKTLNLDN